MASFAGLEFLGTSISARIHYYGRTFRVYRNADHCNLRPCTTFQLVSIALRYHFLLAFPDYIWLDAHEDVGRTGLLCSGGHALHVRLTTHRTNQLPNVDRLRTASLAVAARVLLLLWPMFQTIVVCSGKQSGP